jgi:FkbM family methyltransferase
LIRPAIEGVSETCRHLRRRILKYVRVWAQIDGVRSAANYAIAILWWRGSSRSASVVPVGLRSAPDHPLLCRIGSTDPEVLADAFGGLYHRPPADLDEVSRIIDLGSNIGATIVQLATVFPDSQFVGVELDRGNYEMCVANTKHLGNRCTILWAAAWTHDGEVRYGGRQEWEYQVSASGEKRAPALAMATILNRAGGAADYLKMDIEGAERDILRNASEWAPLVRCIRVEVHIPYTTDECIRDLEAAGFRCRMDVDQTEDVIGMNAGFCGGPTMTLS